MFKSHLVCGLLLLLGVSSQTDEDEDGPYEFSFTIDGQQHRYEKKDINGIIEGEFGFITGDGVYHVSVYATDENGSYRVLSMKNTKISEPLDQGGVPGSTLGLIRQGISVQQPTGGIPSKAVPPIGKPSPPVAIPPPPAATRPLQPSYPASPSRRPSPPAAVPTTPAARPLQPVITTSWTPYDFTTPSTIRNGCSGCGIVTKAPPGPLNFQNPAFKKGNRENKSLVLPAEPSSPNQPIPSPVTSSNEIPSTLISKPFSPTTQPSANANTNSGLSNKPVNITPPLSYPKQPTSAPGDSDIGIPDRLVSKLVLPVTQPSSNLEKLSGSSTSRPNKVVTIAPISSNSKQIISSPGDSRNGIPDAVVPKPVLPIGQPSSISDKPSDSSTNRPNTAENIAPPPSYPKQPTSLSGDSHNGIPDAIVSKPILPVTQPSSNLDRSYSSSTIRPNASVNIAPIPYNPKQLISPPGDSGNGIPGALASKPVLATGASSANRSNKPVDIAPPLSYAKQPTTTPGDSGNGIPSGLVPKPVLLVEQPSSIPNKPSGTSTSRPNKPVESSPTPSNPKQVISPPGDPGSGIPDALVSKPVLPVEQPSSIHDKPSASSTSRSNKPEEIAPRASYPKQPISQPGDSDNGIPDALVSKSVLPVEKPSSIADKPSGSSTSRPNKPVEITSPPSSPKKPTSPPVDSGNGIPSGSASKPVLPVAQPPSTLDKPSGSSTIRPNKPVDIAQPASYPEQPISPSGDSGNGIPSGLVSKSVLPIGQPSSNPDKPSGSSTIRPNKPVDIAQPTSYPEQPISPSGDSGDGIPSGLVSKSVLAIGQPSSNPDKPSGSSTIRPNKPVDIAQPASYPAQPISPSGDSGNGIPSGLVSKSGLPIGQPSSNPDKPSGSSTSRPNKPVDIAQPASYPKQPISPPGDSGNGIPSGLVSKPFLPAGQPSTNTAIPAGPSINIPNKPVNIAKLPNYPNQPASPLKDFGNGIPNGSVAKPVLPAEQAVGNGQRAPPQTLLLAPGTNPTPARSDKPTEYNSFGPQSANKPITLDSPREPKALGSRPPISQPGSTQNQLLEKPPSVLSQVSVTNGVINIPGNEPIVIRDKYPNMVDGLPEGITERDITDLLYKFNYTVGFHGHYERGLKNGAKIGGYFVNGRDGYSRVVTYIADENGYRPKFKLINLGLDSEDTPKPDSEKKFGLKNFEFVWYPIN